MRVIRMALTKERLLEEISESSGFSTVFNSCSRELQNLLINLVIEISRYSCNREGYVKNMKETSIRFEKPYLVGRKNQNYCMLTLRPRLNQIVVDVRTDGKFINSETLKLINLGNKYNGGFEWHRFVVKDENEIKEAVRLISKCYEG